jgi:uncharacterized membrane protein YhaH (DUF805 family)
MGQLLFGFDGRIGRGPFWAGQMVVVVLAALYARYADELLVLWIPGSIFMGSAFALVLALPMLWIQAALTIKRCHDRGKTGFWSMLLLVPVLGLVWLVIDCGLLPGVADVRASAPTTSRTAL